MKSRITIEVDFENGNLPVIQVLATNSDDVRDRLISAFLQSLQHTSRWCKIEYKGEISDGLGSFPYSIFKWQITPITPSQIPEEIKLMHTIWPQISSEPIDDNNNSLLEALRTIKHKTENGHWKGEAEIVDFADDAINKHTATV